MKTGSSNIQKPFFYYNATNELTENLCYVCSAIFASVSTTEKGGVNCSHFRNMIFEPVRVPEWNYRDCSRYLLFILGIYFRFWLFF